MDIPHITVDIAYESNSLWNTEEDNINAEAPSDIT